MDDPLTRIDKKSTNKEFQHDEVMENELKW